MCLWRRKKLKLNTRSWNYSYDVTKFLKEKRSPSIFLICSAFIITNFSLVLHQFRIYCLYIENLYSITLFWEYFQWKPNISFILSFLRNYCNVMTILCQYRENICNKYHLYQNLHISELLKYCSKTIYYRAKIWQIFVLLKAHKNKLTENNHVNPLNKLPLCTLFKRQFLNEWPKSGRNARKYKNPHVQWGKNLKLGIHSFLSFCVW